MKRIAALLTVAWILALCLVGCFAALTRIRWLDDICERALTDL